MLTGRENMTHQRDRIVRLDPRLLRFATRVHLHHDIEFFRAKLARCFIQGIGNFHRVNGLDEKEVRDVPHQHFCLIRLDVANIMPLDIRGQAWRFLDKFLDLLMGKLKTRLLQVKFQSLSDNSEQLDVNDDQETQADHAHPNQIPNCKNSEAQNTIHNTLDDVKKHVKQVQELLDALLDHTVQINKKNVSF
ncbi:hypothetical protein PsorP6_016382 [Peronosclerospora sorghi]|uniref:Uncharacterized protein n=1 Tax=Peronosclerospora sorghi TaxID=230839 RepID=A0ACC0VN40_9STRA|nr:hypothetical protein PsorP6_016382 [Peronosclerospora sorghi]